MMGMLLLDRIPGPWRWGLLVGTVAAAAGMGVYHTLKRPAPTPADAPNAPDVLLLGTTSPNLTRQSDLLSFHALEQTDWGRESSALLHPRLFHRTVNSEDVAVWTHTDLMKHYEEIDKSRFVWRFTLQPDRNGWSPSRQSLIPLDAALVVSSIQAFLDTAMNDAALRPDGASKLDLYLDRCEAVSGDRLAFDCYMSQSVGDATVAALLSMPLLSGGELLEGWPYRTNSASTNEVTLTLDPSLQAGSSFPLVQFSSEALLPETLLKRLQEGGADFADRMPGGFQRRASMSTIATLAKSEEAIVVALINGRRIADRGQRLALSDRIRAFTQQTLSNREDVALAWTLFNHDEPWIKSELDAQLRTGQQAGRSPGNAPCLYRDGDLCFTWTPEIEQRALPEDLRIGITTDVLATDFARDLAVALGGSHAIVQHAGLTAELQRGTCDILIVRIQDTYRSGDLRSWFPDTFTGNDEDARYLREELAHRASASPGLDTKKYDKLVHHYAIGDGFAVPLFIPRRQVAWRTDRLTLKTENIDGITPTADLVEWRRPGELVQGGAGESP